MSSTHRHTKPLVLGGSSNLRFQSSASAQSVTISAAPSSSFALTLPSALSAGTSVLTASASGSSGSLAFTAATSATPVASSTSPGLMSSTDKTAVDGLPTTYAKLAANTFTGIQTLPSPVELKSTTAFKAKLKAADELTADVTFSLPSTVPSNANVTSLLTIATSGAIAFSAATSATPFASSTSPGLMSTTDKTTIDGLPMTYAPLRSSLLDKPSTTHFTRMLSEVSIARCYAFSVTGTTTFYVTHTNAFRRENETYPFAATGSTTTQLFYSISDADTNPSRFITSSVDQAGRPLAYYAHDQQEWGYYPVQGSWLNTSFDSSYNGVQPTYAASTYNATFQFVYSVPFTSFEGILMSPNLDFAVRFGSRFFQISVVGLGSSSHFYAKYWRTDYLLDTFTASILNAHAGYKSFMLTIGPTDFAYVGDATYRNSMAMFFVIPDQNRLQPTCEIIEPPIANTSMTCGYMAKGEPNAASPAKVFGMQYARNRHRVMVRLETTWRPAIECDWYKISSVCATAAGDHVFVAGRRTFNEVAIVYFTWDSTKSVYIARDVVYSKANNTDLDLIPQMDLNLDNFNELCLTALHGQAGSTNTVLRTYKILIASSDVLLVTSPTSATGYWIYKPMLTDVVSGYVDLTQYANWATGYNQNVHTFDWSGYGDTYKLTYMRMGNIVHIQGKAKFVVATNAVAACTLAWKLPVILNPGNATVSNFATNPWQTNTNVVGTLYSLAFTGPSHVTFVIFGEASNSSVVSGGFPLLRIYMPQCPATASVNSCVVQFSVTYTMI